MLSNFFNIIRWPNLLMVALIQYLIYTQLLVTSRSVLEWNGLALLSIITMLIAASGYVINDYYDAAIDRINRPDRLIAGNAWTIKQVLITYYSLIATGAGISVVLALKLSMLTYLFIYPLAVSGLWLYSYALKCKPVAGNLWVALFCAGVVVIVALPDWLSGHEDIISPDLWYYAAFAFLTTWYREVVKDLEDVEGDARASCQTFIVRYGLLPGKIMALILGVILLTALYAWDIKQSGNTVKLIFTIMHGAIIATMAFIWWARDNVYFHHASLVIKGVMLVGTSLLLII